MKYKVGDQWQRKGTKAVVTLIEVANGLCVQPVRGTASGRSLVWCKTSQGVQQGIPLKTFEKNYEPYTFESRKGRRR